MVNGRMAHRLQSSEVLAWHGNRDQNTERVSHNFIDVYSGEQHVDRASLLDLASPFILASFCLLLSSVCSI